MSPAIDPKELKTLSDILALVLEDQPGQSANALEAIRARARKNAVTGGALKNLFVAIAPNPPAPNPSTQRAPRSRSAKTAAGPAEMQAARTRISQLTADLNRLDLELREAGSRNESMRAELNLTRRARAEAQQAMLQAHAESSRPRVLLLVLTLICGILVGIAGSAVVGDLMPARGTDSSPLQQSP
ncbi:hypothetical protein [Lichenicoccus sp.]|uniref:hypothetical protein n=1 Tax=Lichenicoccus sp. TaxID=2781899 RepID=UPI003D134875